VRNPTPPRPVTTRTWSGLLAPPEGLRITVVRRHPDGHWTAHVTRNGVTVAVDNSARLWAITPPARASAKAALRRGESITEIASTAILARLNDKVAAAHRGTTPDGRKDAP
jgi:hypothetical protein